MSDSKHQLSVHERYRVQRLIRMGEWLEHNAPILLALFEGIDNAHTKAMDEDGPCDTIKLEELIDTQMNPLRGMFSLLLAIRHHSNWSAVAENVDVTLRNPCSCKELVVIPANPETKTES